jgi:hypothetical protein
VDGQATTRMVLIAALSEIVPFLDASRGGLFVPSEAVSEGIDLRDTRRVIKAYTSLIVEGIDARDVARTILEIIKELRRINLKGRINDLITLGGTADWELELLGELTSLIELKGDMA